MKWDTIKLGDIAVLRGGSVNPKKHPLETFELHSIPAFDAGKPEIVLGSEIGSSKKMIEPNDIMISKIVPHIRRACVVGPKGQYRQIASGEWISFRSENLHPEYLRCVLVGDAFHSAFMSTVSGVGGSLLRARPAEVYKIQIPLPPLSEQKRIAGILDAADRLRAKRREALAQLDTLLQSTFLDLFGDPVTNPKGWEELALTELCESHHDIRCGPFGTQLQQHEFKHSGVPLWGIKHVNKGFSFPTVEFVSESKADALSQYSIIEGDLVMTRKGTIGNCHIYPTGFEAGIMHSDLLRLRVSPQKVNAQFLCSQLGYSAKIQRQILLMSPGAVMPGINVSKLKKLKVECPPLPLQQRFATIVEKVEAQKTRMRSQLTELDTLFAALQQRAFNGEL